MSLSSSITLEIQSYLRLYYIDSSLSVLVMKHRLTGHFSVYLSSSHGHLYRAYGKLYVHLNALLAKVGVSVLSFEIIVFAPLTPIKHTQNPAPSTSKQEISRASSPWRHHLSPHALSISQLQHCSMPYLMRELNSSPFSLFAPEPEENDVLSVFEPDFDFTGDC